MADLSPETGPRGVPAGRSPGEAWAGAPAPARELLALAEEVALLAAKVHQGALTGSLCGSEGGADGGAPGSLAIESKSSATDVVTRVDREAEQAIAEAVLRARPNDSIVAEEGTLQEGASGVRWLVDPLDGTTNYVYGYPFFSVSIGVEVDGRPAVGVVHDTMAGRTYAAIAGHGAVCGGRPIRVRRSGPLAEALVATGFSYGSEVRARQAAALATILPRVRDIRRSGSAALDLCSVAAGRVDAFYEIDLSPWDWAAGCVIAAAAGADVVATDDRGGRTSLVFAAPPHVMPGFRELLVEAGVVAEARLGGPS